MFDLGFGIVEIVVLALIALIVVGPKDLPNLFYNIGNVLGRLRKMVTEFKFAMDDIVHEQEIEQTKKSLEMQQKTQNTQEKE